MRVENTQTSGFTLLEVIVAIVVATLVTTGLYTMVNNIRGLNDRSRDLITVNSLIEDKIEELRSATYLGLSDGEFDFSDELPQTIAAPREAVYVVTATENNLRQVSLSVTYNEAGTARTIDYITYIGELGVGQY